MLAGVEDAGVIELNTDATSDPNGYESQANHNEQ